MTMRILGIAGWSGSGKTTLIEKLIPALAARGIAVSTIKHAHHQFDVDVPGKDSWRHRQAGAHEVLVASDRRFALLHENAVPGEPDLDVLVARLAPVDLVLVEGFKRAPIPFIEVWRAASRQPRLSGNGQAPVALVCDRPSESAGETVLPLDDPDAVADFIFAWLQRG